MEFTYSRREQAMKPSIIRELLKQTVDPNLISFAGGNPAADAFPTEAIAEISARLLAEEGPLVLQYSHSEGYPGLRAAAPAYLNSEHRVVGEGDDILITSGSQQVMDFMAKLLCNEGDIVAVEDPVFLGGLNAFRSHGARLVGVRMEADGPSLAALEAVLNAPEKPRFFYTVPNFQNPTGAVCSLEKRREVYRLCAAAGVPILEDNPYGELRIEGEGLPPIKSFDEENAVVYAASLSKVLAPGMRVAFCVGAKELVGKMTVAKQSNDVHTNLWGQRVCERFLTQYDMAAHLERLRGIYGAKAKLMDAELRRHMGDKASWAPPQGGMFVWLTLPEAVPTPDYVQRCLARKVAVVPGNPFYVDEAAPCQSIRVNYSAPSEEEIREGARIMGEVLEEMLSEH